MTVGEFLNEKLSHSRLLLNFYLKFIKPESLATTSFGGAPVESLRLIDVLSRTCYNFRSSIYERMFENSFIRVNDTNVYRIINKNVDKTDFFDFSYDRTNLDNLLKGIGATSYNANEVVNSSLYDFVVKFGYDKVPDSFQMIVENRFKYLLIRQRLLENTIGYTYDNSKKFDEYVVKAYANNKKINKDFFLDLNNILLMFSSDEKNKNGFLAKSIAFNGTMISRCNSTDAFNHKRKLNALQYIFEQKTEDFYKILQSTLDIGSDEIVYRFTHNASSSYFRIDYKISSKEFHISLASNHNPRKHTNQIIKNDLDTIRGLKLFDAFEKIIFKYEKKENQKI